MANINSETLTGQKVFEDGLEVRNLVSDLLCKIQDCEEGEQVISIDYAIKMLNDLKKELNT